MRAETVASSCQSFRISEASSFHTRLKENKQKLQELEVSTREMLQSAWHAQDSQPSELRSRTNTIPEGGDVPSLTADYDL